ncbi:MAG TPA: M56 family metallopeptidase, partial [Planctomycetaceae bacterium]|nr:M56 family metallopeptidase [Planctomycetaceae bacterium]
RALARWSQMFEPCLSDDVCRAARLAKERTGLAGTISVLESEVVPAPVTFGLFHPKIVVPSGLAGELPFEQICAVMQHEVAHIARRDLWIGVIQECAQVVHWWNPLVSLANRRLTDLREQICDDIATCGLARRSDYAALLVDIAARCATPKRVPGGLGFGASPVRQLEERVRRVLGSPTPDSVRLGRRAAFGVLGVAAVMTATMLFAQVRLQSPQEKPADPVTRSTAAGTAPVGAHSDRPTIHELFVKIAEYERAYLPYYIKATETFRTSEGLTPQERARYPWADGRKHQKLMEYAQTEDRLWLRKETRLVDGVAQGHSERYSDGKQFVTASFREGRPVRVDIQHDPAQFERWVAATPLRGIFPLAVWSNGDLLSRVFAGRESDVQLDWEGDDARLTFRFGPQNFQSRFVLWLSRAHDWHPVKLQRFVGAKSTLFFDEWVVTRFGAGSNWRVADGTLRYRDPQEGESPNARVVYSIDFHLDYAEYGFQGFLPGSGWKPMLVPGSEARLFKYQIPPGADVHDSQRLTSDRAPAGPVRPIMVRVVDVAGDPVAGAIVQLRRRLEPGELDQVETNENGVAHSPKAPQDDDVAIETTAGGYRSATWVLGSGSNDLPVILAPQTHGFAVDQKGRPQPNVWLPADRPAFRNDGLPYIPQRGLGQGDWGSSDGQFALTSSLTLRRANQLVPLIGFDESVEKMAIAFVAPKDLAEPQTLVFKPVCHVHGGCLLEGVGDMKSLGLSLSLEADNGQTVALLSPRMHPETRGLRVDWDFRLPAGTYSVVGRHSSSHAAIRLPITIAPGQRELDAAIKNIPASGLIALAGKPAPPLEVEWRPGQETTLASLRGRVVVLDFWGTWCIPCMNELPGLMDVAERFKDRPVEWIAIHTPLPKGFTALDSTVADFSRRFWKKRDLTLKTVIDQPLAGDDQSGKTQTRYGIAEWPTILVIDQAGRIVGPVKKDELADTINALLKRQTKN